jgi:hypothetical protein
MTDASSFPPDLQHATGDDAPNREATEVDEAVDDAQQDPDAQPDDDA